MKADHTTNHETSWLSVIVVGCLFGSLIIAGVIIVKSQVLIVSQDTILQTATDWEVAAVDTVDLDTIPEGNEALLDVANSTTSTVATTTETTTTETTDGDATEWLEFDSRTLPIRFNYPADWKLWEGTSPLSDYIQIADYQSKPQDAFAETVPGHKLEVAIVMQPEDMALKKWIKTTDKEFTNRVGTYEDVLIDGFPGILDYQVLGYSTFASVYIPLGDGSGQVILLSLYGPEENFEQLRPLLQDILDSVHITKK